MRQGRCSTCDAPILWVTTAAGKAMPVDAEPAEFGGNIVIRNDTAITLKKGEPSEAGEKRFKSHFATCAQSAQHRKQP